MRTNQKDEEGYYRWVNCPICGSYSSAHAVTCEETPNYSECICPTHGLLKVFKDGRIITLQDKLNDFCLDYIFLLNCGDISINRVDCHEKICLALGKDHDDVELKKVTDNLDKELGLPINGTADVKKYGNLFYNLLVDKFIIRMKPKQN